MTLQGDDAWRGVVAKGARTGPVAGQPARELRRVVVTAPRPPTSPDWSLMSGLTPSQLTQCLWLIAALLELFVDVAGGATWATVLRVTFTYGFGFGLALAAVALPGRTGMSTADFSFARILALAVPSGTILFLVDVVGRAFEHGASPLRTFPIDFLLRVRVNWAYFSILFVFQSTITWLSASAKALALRERQLAEAREAALRLQLNPHFLFNTLNSILALVEEAGAVQAEHMIQRLSEFLEATLAIEPTMLTSLAVELELVAAYLAIEAARFGDRLQVEYTCEQGLGEVLVPQCILQPLVENAVKHAVAASNARVTVAIGARRDDDALVLSVRDDGVASNEPFSSGFGLGLRNVAARLQAIYGPAAVVETSPIEDVGFSAVVRIPICGAP